MTDAGIRVVIQALYGGLIFAALLFGAIFYNDGIAFVVAALGVLAVVMSQSFSIAGQSRTASVSWWSSIILAAISAVLLVRG